jgi:hypothetical protein
LSLVNNAWGIEVTKTVAQLAITLVGALAPFAIALAPFVVALAALTAGLCVESEKARAAAGDEPWCIVDDEGNSHCNYATSQECLQATTSGYGSRGFCNVNPSPAPASAPARRRAQ